MHAHAVETLAPFLKPGAKVLDVGSGSGYLCAVFGEMVVCSSHHHPPPPPSYSSPQVPNNLTKKSIWKIELYQQLLIYGYLDSVETQRPSSRHRAHSTTRESFLSEPTKVTPHLFNPLHLTQQHRLLPLLDCNPDPSI